MKLRLAAVLAVAFATSAIADTTPPPPPPTGTTTAGTPGGSGSAAGAGNAATGGASSGATGAGSTATGATGTDSTGAGGSTAGGTGAPGATTGAGGTRAPSTPAKPATPAPKAPAPKARMSTAQPRTGVRATKADDGDGRLDKKEDTVADGKHWRIKTSQGSVHVWIPEDYDRETAGTVIYVHGYWVDADGAWSQYELAKQFKRSRQNAMFIVPDAPQNNDDSVKWPALKDLRKAVARANIKLPDGPTVVMGHSGAFRTIMQWVDHKLVDQIILLDAMYSGESAFDEFIASGKRADDHKLIVVGAGTAQESGAFAKKYKFAVAREKLPSSVSDFTKRERGAKLLYIRSQYEHMQIVTSGKVIPLLLRLTPLKAL